MKRTNILFLIITFCLILPTQKIISQQVNHLFENTWYGFNTGLYSYDRYPTSAVLADFNNDGHLDVAVSKYQFSTGFALLLNNGEGFYPNAIHYSSLHPSMDITCGDFNNDGLLDIALSNTGANSEGNTVSVFSNQGGGNFSNPVNYSVGTGPVGITTADFNNDGFTDLAVANYGWLGQGTTISVLFNNGDGSFANQLTFPAGTGPFDIKTAKINNDNFFDLIVANDNQKLNVLLNSGGNDFSNRIEYNVFSSWPNDLYPNIALSDMDNDSDIDVLYSSTRTWNGDRGLIAYFKNDGNGNLLSPLQIQLLNFTTGSTNISVADLDNNGWNDIVAAELFSGSANFQVVLSNGAGGFLPVAGYFAGRNTYDVMTGDVNGDNLADVLTTDNSSLQITVHHNVGNGSFVIPQLYLTLPISGSLDAEDVDNDGDLDLISSASGRGTTGVHVAVLKNNGDGTFSTYQTYPIRSGGVQAKFRDINNDGFADIIFATSISSPPYDFHFAVNSGNGIFGPIQTRSVGSCGWYDIDAFDLDNDSYSEIILTEWLGCPGIPTSGRRIFICKNNGDGTFQSPNIVLADGQVGAIAGADLNNDGNIDLVIGQPYSIGVFLGTGTGSLLPQINYLTDGKHPEDIIIDDFNNDGIPDIAASTFFDESGMSVWIGNGDGTFMQAINYPNATVEGLLNVTGITSGDADNDGDNDIFVGNHSSNSISFYRNNGDGTFTYDFRIGVYSGAASPFFGEFTGDGKMDVALLVNLPPSGIGKAVTILKGLNTGIIPVELTSFTASVNNRTIYLNWVTASETNNRGFEVQRYFSPHYSLQGTDNGSWTTIGFVAGFGTTTEPRSYSFTDEIQDQGSIRYRLKQIDFDGSFNYSNVVEARVTTPLKFELSQNYPNPFNPITRINYQLKEKGFVSLKIFDMLGMEVANLVNETQAEGQYSVVFDASNLPSGVYIYSLRVNDFVQNNKMTFLK